MLYLNLLYRTVIAFSLLNTINNVITRLDLAVIETKSGQDNRALAFILVLLLHEDAPCVTLEDVLLFTMV